MTLKAQKRFTNHCQNKHCFPSQNFIGNTWSLSSREGEGRLPPRTLQVAFQTSVMVTFVWKITNLRWLKRIQNMRLVFASGHCVRSWIRPTLHPRRLRSQLGSLGHMDLLLQGEPVDQASGKSFTKVKVLTSIFPLLDIVGPRELDWQRSVFFPANCIVGSKPTLRSLLFVSMWEKIHAHCYILEKLFSFVSSFLLIAFSSTAWAHLPFISQPVPHFRISNSKETTHSSSLSEPFSYFAFSFLSLQNIKKSRPTFSAKVFNFSKYIDWQEEKIYLLKLFSPFQPQVGFHRRELGQGSSFSGKWRHLRKQQCWLPIHPSEPNNCRHEGYSWSTIDRQRQPTQEKKKKPHVAGDSAGTWSEVSRGWAAQFPRLPI